MIYKLITGTDGQPIGLDYGLLLFDEMFEKEQEEVRKKKKRRKDGKRKKKKRRKDGKVLR